MIECFQNFDLHVLCHFCFNSEAGFSFFSSWNGQGKLWEIDSKTAKMKLVFFTEFAGLVEYNFEEDLRNFQGRHILITGWANIGGFFNYDDSGNYNGVDHRNVEYLSRSLNFKYRYNLVHSLYFNLCMKAGKD